MIFVLDSVRKIFVGNNSFGNGLFVFFECVVFMFFFVIDFGFGIGIVII